MVLDQQLCFAREAGLSNFASKTNAAASFAVLLDAPVGAFGQHQRIVSAEIAGMDALSLDDLIHGRNDWCNIPEILRATFRVFHDVIHTQAGVIKRQQQEITALTEALDSKADIVSVNEALSRKANKDSVSQALHKKANKQDIDERLAGFACASR